MDTDANSTFSALSITQITRKSINEPMVETTTNMSMNTDNNNQNDNNNDQSNATMGMNQKWMTLDAMFKSMLQRSAERANEDVFLKYCQELGFSMTQSHLLYHAIRTKYFDQHASFQKQQISQSQSSSQSKSHSISFGQMQMLTPMVIVQPKSQKPKIKRSFSSV